MSYDKFVIDRHFYKDLIETQIVMCEQCFIMQTAYTQARTKAHTGTCTETKTKLNKVHALVWLRVHLLVCLSVLFVYDCMNVYRYLVQFFVFLTF